MKQNNFLVKALATSLLTASLVAAGATQAEAQTSSTFTLNQTRSRLVVLLHGVTSEQLQAPEEKINTSAHARSYWGFDFIKGLQGKLEESKMQVITPLINGTLRFKTTSKDEWIPTTTDSKTFDLNPICFPTRWFTNLPAGIETNQTLIRDYINIMGKNQGAEGTMVMVDTHDGSKHLMTQLGQTIDKVYMSYFAAFGSMPIADQPQIYLVGHSFGGIMARGILANPTDTDLFGVKLTASQRQRADYLRQRVVVVQTLASPHEGAMVKDPSSDFSDYVQKNGMAIINDIVALSDWWNDTELTKAQMREKAQAMFKKAIDTIAGKRDCLDDLYRMNEYNAGILNPNTARRIPNGPLVPIYTAAARNPGGNYFEKSRRVKFVTSTPFGYVFNPIDSIDLISKGDRFSSDSAILNLMEGIFHFEGYGKEGKKPYGTSINPEGDRIKGPWMGMGPNTARPLSAGWTPNANRLLNVGANFLAGNPYVFGAKDGEYDNDGFLGWDSAMGLNINASNYYRIYDQGKYGTMLPWDNDNHSTIRFNPGTAQWIHNEIIRAAGPLVTQVGARRSSWSSSDIPTTPKTGVKVEVLSIEDTANDFDFWSQADFKLNVQVGSAIKGQELPGNTKKVTTAKPFEFPNLVGTVIPIRIDCADIDTPDPDDLGVMSPVFGKSSIWLYVDTRTGRISGDANGVVGQTLNLSPLWVNPVFWSVDNKVASQLKITLMPASGPALP